MPTPLRYLIQVKPTSLLYVFPAETGKFRDRQEFEVPRIPTECPQCGAFNTITPLPSPILAEQHDGTTHVCFKPAGGCNHGFAVEGVQS